MKLRETVQECDWIKDYFKNIACICMRLIMYRLKQVFKTNTLLLFSFSILVGLEL